MSRFSPQVRGWSSHALLKLIQVSVFPAGAGVILKCGKWIETHHGFPRRCGGDPSRQYIKALLFRFSPQVRGWSITVLFLFSVPLVFPAGAGVIPEPRAKHETKWRFPRRCGGDPISLGFSLGFKTFSPQVRGWSRLTELYKRNKFVFPAGAGVIPSGKNLRYVTQSFPRRCGGDPPQKHIQTIRC